MFLFQGRNQVYDFSLKKFHFLLQGQKWCLFVVFGQRLHFAIVPEASFILFVTNTIIFNVTLFIRFKLFPQKSNYLYFWRKNGGLFFYSAFMLIQFTIV